MANRAASEVPFLLVGGRDLLASVVTSFDEATEGVLGETTGIGPTHGVWKSSKGVGIRFASMAQSGFFDTATGGVHDALNERQGISQVVSYAFSGGAIGAMFVGLEGAFGSKYKRVLTLTDLHKANADYTVTGAKEEGKLLHGATAETGATWDSEASSVDNAASSAAGGAGYLQVLDLTLGGYTSATVNVRHSADNAVWATLMTFTAVTAGPSAERKPVAGTVNRYLATSGAWVGAGSDMSITPVVGFYRG